MELKTYINFFLLLFTRYIVVAGIAFLVFYIFFYKKFYRIKLQKAFPKKNDYLREVLFSLQSMGIIALFVFALRSNIMKQHSRMYYHISDYGIVYFVASIFLAMLVHDAYFYWTHRAMHHPKLFKLFHLVHHKSTNPSPWAAYSFHPLEAMVEGGVVWVIVLTVPIHPLAFGIFAVLMITYNVYGHLGYEIYPKWLINSAVGKWLNTSTSHNMHHKYFKDNYGLYFRFWDEIMKTTHPKYDTAIDEIVSKPKPQEEARIHLGNVSE